MPLETPPPESFPAGGPPEEIFEFEQPHLYDGEYVLPSSRFLTDPPPSVRHSDQELVETAQLIVDKTTEFKVPGKIMHKSPGPVVTTFEFKPEAGVKYSRVTGLVDDLCLALKAESIRIDRIPGKAYVGIEVPNRKRETIFLREVIESDEFKKSESLLTLGLGKTIDGTKYVADLAKMPHLLIAGATGAGKSVGVNTLVMSILYKAKPDEVKFIMVDPKRLELGLYAGIPHLMHEIIVEPKKAANALRRMVVEMERRYKDLAGYGVRNIDGYNVEAKRRNELEQWDDNGEPHKKLPYIVIIIDEFAELLLTSAGEVEDLIVRIAQKGRAAGIHLILATQKPSSEVVAPLIKSNLPARIAFTVRSRIDSRTILDAGGAESLLGQGDMLFLPPGQSSVTRVHGAYVDEKEIKAVVDFIKEQGIEAIYETTIGSPVEIDGEDREAGRPRDPLFYDALRCVVKAKRGSTSLLQRHLSIGYGRAAKILDSMVREGMVGEMDGSTRARPILDQAAIALMDLRPHPESLEMQSEAPVVREAPIQARMPFLLHLSRFFAFAAVVLFVIGLGSCAASLGGDGENTPNTFIIGLFSLIFCILLAMLSACCYLLCSPSSTAATVPPNDSRPRRKSYRRRGKRGGGIMKTVRSQIKKYGD